MEDQGLPEGFSHVLEEDAWLNELWSGRIDVPDRQAMDLECARHIREHYQFSYNEVRAILGAFPYGAAGTENGSYLDETILQAGFPRSSSVADVIKMAPRVEYERPPFLARGYVTTAVGAPGAGKSAAVLDIGGRLLTGSPWPDSQAHSPRDCVIWADTESTQALLAQRVVDWRLPADRILMPLSDPLKAQIERSQCEYVFVQRDGYTPYRSVRTAFETACERATLSDVTPHVLRHTFASRLVMNGAPLRTVQELGGWKTVAMVARYAHLSEEHKQQSVELIGRKAAGFSLQPKEGRSSGRPKLVKTKTVGV